MGRNLPIVLVMRWVVRVRNRGFWCCGWVAGGEGGSGGGCWGCGARGDAGEDGDEEGCALIGLGAEIWDIHRGCGMCHWHVPEGFWIWIDVWRGE